MITTNCLYHHAADYLYNSVQLNATINKKKENILAVIKASYITFLVSYWTCFEIVRIDSRKMINLIFYHLIPILIFEQVVWRLRDAFYGFKVCREACETVLGVHGQSTKTERRARREKIEKKGEEKDRERRAENRKCCMKI
jgi:hypothetical protein